MRPLILAALALLASPTSSSAADQEANKRGLFGVSAPDFRVLVELLFSPIGLLILTPVMIVGAVGLVLVYRRGHRLEASVAGAVLVCAAGILALRSTGAAAASPAA